MPMNDNLNPNRNQDVAPQRTTMIPIVIGLVIALAIGIIGYTYFFSDSSTTQPINRSEDNTLSAPTLNPDSNNKPFDSTDKNNPSPGQTKNY